MGPGHVGLHGCVLTWLAGRGYSGHTGTAIIFDHQSWRKPRRLSSGHVMSARLVARPRQPDGRCCDGRAARLVLKGLREWVSRPSVEGSSRAPRFRSSRPRLMSTTAGIGVHCGSPNGGERTLSRAQPENDGPARLDLDRSQRGQEGHHGRGAPHVVINEEMLVGYASVLLQVTPSQVQRPSWHKSWSFSCSARGFSLDPHAIVGDVDNEVRFAER